MIARTVRRKRLSAAWALGLLLLLPLPAAAQLKPAVQIDLYLVQTEDYIKEKDYAAAQDAMGKILALSKEHDIPVPAAFHFKYAQVLDMAGSYEEAVTSLHLYLEVAGRSGEHYREALELLHKVSKAQEERELLQPGERFRECEGCPQMIVVPAGAFTMGSPTSEAGRDGDEGPQHRVTIREAFAVGVYEVTFAEWAACVAGGGCGAYRPDDHGWGRGNRPVIYVSWLDAQKYVEWLSRKTGQAYRLLSEAEWEYATRAGMTAPFHYGSTISTSQANYDGNYVYGSGRKGQYRERTVPVGSFGANAFGLYDVHGNVWEWVQDCWNGNYAGAPSDGSAWESGDCGRRVLRGGSWDSEPWILRSANRIRITIGNRRDNGFGFRVARTL